MDKKTLRNRFLKIRGEIPRDIRAEKSRMISERLFSLKEFKDCSSVFVYASYATECETYGIIKKALSEGKRTALPVILKEKGKMAFVEICSPQGLVKNHIGIPEPLYEEAKVVFPQKGDVVIMPGAAFTPDGRRLGYGGGYYDRYLSRYTEAFKIGICFREQLAESLPFEEYDIKADIVITDLEVL